ncbi:ABC transporter ATP-binding protein [Nocardiopsis dassonvillei]|uniref:ATP-binding cassette domain-containing protein n=1 Tax=Nocardiopsis dassonvillei TaxID=2014 RepID=UPI00200BDD91|nr:ABC transporter ATP-binding protein [Nocardiopsis dassonvillei]MCK9874170.1 ABC transporter ATP-binding protein [Nocardiopsis dassonvillei]
MTSRIEARNLRIAYGDDVVFDDLSFALSGDKVYGLLGRNGSGKTTLLSALASLREVDGGRLTIDGRPVFEDPVSMGRVCFRQSNDELIGWLGTVDDIVEFTGRMYPRWDPAYASRLIELFGLTGRTSWSALSHGQRSSLNSLLGLASRAPITLLDEPYLGMDASTREVLRDEILADCMTYPRMLIVSTHLVEEFGPLFEEILMIDKGELLLHETADRLRAQGATIIGPADRVDEVAEGLNILDERRLGQTKSLTVFGELDDGARRRAREAGLDVGPLGLEQLFIHLTGGGEGRT